MKLHFCLFFALFCQIYGQKSPVTAYTSRGPLVGYHLDLGNDTTKDWYGQADIFLGVPFATPPTGKLRYKQPRPLVQFPGSSPYNATHYRSVCIQPTSHYAFSEQSEDCLYLAIWSPNVKSTTKYPVMVEIHGGGLITGSSRMWDNAIVRNFVSQGIVFVSIDYRMGWLGFFTTFTDDFPPNLGMLDQVMALRFIKEEIGYFGGDSNKITILGQSAGGHSVSAHTYSPLSQNLFQGYIAQSGTVLTCYEDSVGPTYHNLAMAEHACNFTQDMWNSGNFAPLKNCLYNIDAFVAQNITNSLGIHNNWVCWNMVQDNYFLPGNPQTLGPKRPNVNAIVGTCRDEYFAWQIGTVLRDKNLTYYTRQNIESNLLRQYASWFGNSTANAQQVLKIWEDNYLPPGIADDDHLAWLEFIIAVGTPAYFGWGALRDVEYYIKNKNPNVFTYNFVWSSPLNNAGNPLTNYAPAPHGCEDPYLFGWGSSGNWTPDSQKLATLIQNNWVNFVKTGKPSMDNSWQPSTSTDFSAIEYFEYNITGSQTKTGYRAVDDKVWNQLIPPVLGNYPPNLVDSYPVCSHGYTSKVKNSTCYEAFGTQASWKDAQNNCVQNSYGSLVSITSAFENSDLLSYAKSTFPSCTGFYIGLFRGNSNIQDWTWVNYDPTSYRNWRSGSPSQNPYCTVLNANDGTWTTQDCTQTQCYICGHGV